MGSLFPNARLSNLGISSFDHSPLCLELDVRSQLLARHHFRFENAWIREPVCTQLIKDSWYAFSDVSIIEKLNDCRLKLASWVKESLENSNLDFLLVNLR